MRYLITLLLFVCSNVFADLYYDTYRGTGATPSFPGNGGSLTYSTVLSSGTVSSLALNWGTGYVLDSGRNETVIAHFYGKIYIPSAGTYTFYYSGDDGMYMKIDGSVVISDWQEQGRTYYNGSGSKYFASAGYYDIDTWWYENGGGASIYLYWNYGGSTNLISSTYYSLTGPTTSTTTGTSGGITSAQSTSKSQARTRSNNQSDNTVYIDQVGDNNTVTIEQDGTATNTIRGIYSSGDDAGLIQGNSNTIEIRQGADTSTSSNLIEFKIIGSTNDILLYQDRLNTGYEDTLAGGGHNIILDVYGSSNDIDLIQRNNYDTYGGHHINLEVDGSSNTINMKQISDYSKDIFGKVTGSNNSITVYQHDDSNKYLDFDLTGNGHTLDVEQTGTGAHDAEITLIYGSAPSTVNLLQQGSTDQSYSLEQTCYTTGGCSTTVTQGN